MNVVKVTQTFKNGILTSSKSVKVEPPLNPETDKVQKSPKHHQVLDLGDSAHVSMRVAQHSNENLMNEVRKLRKKLLRTENLVISRTKEREALKKAHKSRLSQVRFLKEQNEDLQANVYALEEDYQLLKTSMNTNHTVGVANASRRVVAKVPPSKAANQKSETEEPEKCRAISAKPVKK